MKKFLIIIFIFISTPCMADKLNPISDSTLLRCAIGEAASEGVIGMQAVISAIKNRGTIRGVYGCNANHIISEPDWVWRLAETALRNSKKEDITKGATHWENIEQFGKPYWAEEMVETFRYKHQVFYKEK